MIGAQQKCEILSDGVMDSNFIIYMYSYCDYLLFQVDEAK